MLIENIKNFNFYIILSNIIFMGGIFGVLMAKNAIIWLLSIELMFISSLLNFLIFSVYYYSIEGYLYALFIIILAAAESALGLSIIIIYYNNKKNINISSYKSSKL